MNLRTCVAPSGRFVYGLHKPAYSVANLRQNDALSPLGRLRDDAPVDNQRNFPPGMVRENQADWIFEIPNPFPFRGVTYIDKVWADAKATNPAGISLPLPTAASFRQALADFQGEQDKSPQIVQQVLGCMPEPVLLALAACSTDPVDLVALARLSCEFVDDSEGEPVGLRYERADNGRIKASAHRPALFETVSNNPHLPDPYKEVMVLRPGAQGGSEIVGEWQGTESASHIFEYLRRNSYIPWGHYAANFANDTIRYQAGQLTRAEMEGLRHLYYQRTLVRLAEELDFPIAQRRAYTASELEDLRLGILEKLRQGVSLPFTATLWGWNYGFDFAPSGYRLHASHQQIHQQFALLPPTVPAWHDAGTQASEALSSYGCGDLVADFSKQYRKETGENFFEKYLEAIRGNKRMDRPGEAGSLVVFENEEAMVLVPKAQTSQWELQLLATKPVGNILEADTACRRALDEAMWVTMRLYAAMGARMVTTIEYPKRFDAADQEQHLLYSFLPRLPESPGAFSEAQLRFINGHYPEDFAAACRSRLPEALEAGD